MKIPPNVKYCGKFGLFQNIAMTLISIIHRSKELKIFFLNTLLIVKLDN